MRGSSEGFTLLEALVGFAIAAGAMVLLLRIFSGELAGAERTESYRMAVLLAQSRLAAAGIEAPLQVGETSGEAGERFRWTLRVSPHESAGVPPKSGIRAHRVAVTVWWDGDPGRSVTLTTLRLASGP